MLLYHKLYICLISFLLLWQTGNGQHLQWRATPEVMSMIRQHTPEKVCADSVALRVVLAETLGHLQKQGYFAAQVAVTRNDSMVYAAVEAGAPYQWACLSAGNLSPLMQEHSGFREKFFLKKPFSHTEIEHLFERVLQYAEHTGYPFASVRLTHVKLDNGQVNAVIHYQPGPYITFGRLQVKGTESVSPSFMQAYLGVTEGNAYDKRKVQRIPELLRLLPYILQTAAPQVTYQNETADIILTLAPQQSNAFDGMLNFLPAEGKSEGLLLTGEVNIQLHNLAKSGKQLLFRWQRLQLLSQRLEIGYQHPRMFRAPIDAGFHFSLLKEDTTFLNQYLSMQLGFPFRRGNRLSLKVNRQSSQLLSAEYMESVKNRRELASTRLVNASLEYEYQQTDNILYPRKGYRFVLEGGIGRKKITPYVNLTDTAHLQKTPGMLWQPAIQGVFSQYRTLNKHLMLVHQISAAGMFSEQLYYNEMYRLGGLHSLRGFYDNFFFAAQYALSNLEVRLLFEQTAEAYSYLFVFYDQAYMSGKVYTGAWKDHPAGLGAGISLTTPAGLFSLVYGIGRSAEQKFNPGLSKIHFGYISRF